MDALLAAVPEGWHACSLQGTRQGVPLFGDLDGRNAQTTAADVWREGLHRFSYLGVLETFRVLAVTQSGKIFCSEPDRKSVV